MLEGMAATLGVSVGMLWFLLIAGIWDGVWKLIALWKSARKDKLAWFIVLAIVNSIGILPIIYLVWFDKKKKSK